MRHKTNRRAHSLRTRLILTAVGGAIAGAARALVGWLLNQWG